ncbi:MAG TPA: hypothetical protein VK550_13270 [Polyangiaceae bacterium]|nr:hypothetical protein [Polyangiaceae bacterium]
MRRSASNRRSSVFTLAALTITATAGCGGNDIGSIGFGGNAGASALDAAADSSDAKGGASGAGGAANAGGAGRDAGLGGTTGGANDAGSDSNRGGASDADAGNAGGAGGASGGGGAEGGVADVTSEGGAGGSAGAGGTSGAPGDASRDVSIDAVDGTTVDVRSDSSDGGICPIDNAACSNGGSNGLCKAHICVPCVDGAAPGGDDTRCATAYGGDYLCLGGACTPGDCRSNGDCTLSTSGPLCHIVQPNFCGKCDADAQCLALGPTAPVCNTITGQCVGSNGSCLAQLDNTQCTINGADVCCSSVCSLGDCCPGSVGDQLCKMRLANNSAVCSAGHQCTTCDTAAGLTFLVDPIGGSDGAGTGSGTSGGQPNAGCAFKTISRALQAIGANPAVGTVIQVKNTGPVSVGSNGETFPLNLTANVTVTASGGTVTITPPANQVGFILGSGGAGINGALGGGSILIDGGGHTAYDGVGVTTGSTAATSLQNVTIQNFLREGIRVANGGVLTIKQGVTVTQSGTTSGRRSGLLVTGTGHVSINVAAGQATTAFNGNTMHGIQVEGTGSVSILGALAGPTSTIECRGNAVAGLAIAQTPGTNLPANSIDGVLSFGATIGNGLRIEGGSNVKIRNSSILGNNASGIAVVTWVSGASRNNVLAGIDLGKPSDPGNNVLQTSGGQDPNQGAGICLQMDENSGTLSAQGNAFSGGKNCAATAASLTFNSGNCNGNRDLGLIPSGGGSTNGNDIDVSLCTHP